MTTRADHSSAGRRAWTSAALGLTLAAAVPGCSNLTNVDAPDVVQPAVLNNPAGTEAYTNTALADFNAGLPGFVVNTGLGSDEFFNSNAVIGDADDQRIQLTTLSGYGPTLAAGRARLGAALAIKLRRQFNLTPPSRIGQMFAVKGLAELLLGETVCNGAPLSDITDYDNFTYVLGGPISSDSMLKRAITDFDSALVFAADSPRVVNYIRLGRGRALLNLGRYAEAAAAVNQVPTSYVYNVEVTTAAGGVTNSLWNSNNARSYTVSNREGANGLDYITANDPRVPTRTNGVGTDLLTPVYLFTKYTALTSPMVFSSGLEARLIEAEAALDANRNDSQTTGAGWLGKLNDLRATQITPPMAPLADPGSYDARVNLLFRERAFWMFATGHRFGDMRRLLKRYGRAQNTVWPVGLYKGGLNYGTDVVFTLGNAELTNPQASACTDMNP